MHCENCKKEHDGLYGSGRFCAIKCARGFSTKAKRKEINKKISQTLSRDRELRNCIICNTSFKCLISSTQRYCSLKCSSKNNTAALGKTWKVKDTSKMGGPRPGGGRSTAILYESPIAGSIKLNQEEIEIAKGLDRLCVNWERNFTGFTYIDLEGRKRKFYPDFYIIDYDLYVEYKGWVTNEMKHKMKHALANNDFRLKIIYGMDKRYRNLGLNIEQFIENPLIIFE